MAKVEKQDPTGEEVRQFSINAFPGIAIGLGQSDPLADVATKLQRQYPNHLVLVQAGRFLHGYDRTAHALIMLKKYQAQLVGTPETPHLRCGFPAGNFKKRLWPVVAEFQIPYAVYLGNHADGYTLYVSNVEGMNSAVLSTVSDQIVAEVINDLVARKRMNMASTKQLLENPDSSGFKLKEHAQDLDTQLLHDIIGMPRDLRDTFGQSLRECMARLMGNVFAYGTARDRPAVLLAMSADVDLIKHYMAQAPRLKKLRFAFDHRAGLAVELGRLIGGLIRAGKVTS